MQALLHAVVVAPSETMEKSLNYFFVWMHWDSLSHLPSEFKASERVKCRYFIVMSQNDSKYMHGQAFIAYSHSQ
jgi:hypothetical protein